MYKRHSGIIRKCIKLKPVNFVCRKCSCFTSSTKDDEEVALDDNVIRKMAKFSYLGDVLSSGGGVQEAVTA